MQDFPWIPVPKRRQTQNEQEGKKEGTDTAMQRKKSPLEQLLVTIKHEINGNVTGIP